MTYPMRGGRYVRDAATGELTPAVKSETAAAKAPAEDTASPADTRATATKKKGN